MITITRAVTGFEDEPLLRPFGFKGGAMSNIWQYSVYLEATGDDTSERMEAVGVGCQGVLWSDAAVFVRQSSSAGCAMMYLITEYAAKWLEGFSFSDPQEAFDAILQPTLEYARKVTGRSDLRLTFVLNALVGVDHALWQLYYQNEGMTTFDQAIPKNVYASLSSRYNRLAVIPLLSYGVPVEEAVKMAGEGFFLFKIKIGSDPDKNGNFEEMLKWDMRRLLEIHEALKDIRTSYTESGHIAYYLDANGRYDTFQRMKELLDFARSIGMSERIVLLEEPFAEGYKCSVKELPVRVAADESAHSPEDVRERIALGYGAIALKPIAKTMTVTFRMIEEAQRAGIPCFCADLTVGPQMMSINQAIAARLGCLPGIKIPAMETNGWQNYVNWEEMRHYYPGGDAPWAQMSGGGFDLSEDFYRRGGGIFETSEHYRRLALRK